MKLTLLSLLAFAPFVLAAPIPVETREASPGYANYGDYRYKTYTSYGKYSGYGHYRRENKAAAKKREDYGSCEFYSVSVTQESCFSNGFYRLTDMLDAEYGAYPPEPSPIPGPEAGMEVVSPRTIPTSR